MVLQAVTSPLSDTSKLFQEAATEIKSSRLLQTCESVEMMNSHTAMFVKGLLKSNLNGLVSSSSPSVFCFK